MCCKNQETRNLIHVILEWSWCHRETKRNLETDSRKGEEPIRMTELELPGQDMVARDASQGIKRIGKVKLSRIFRHSQ
jgi:hypothetical protein